MSIHKKSSRSKWSKHRYAWTVAIAIMIAMVVMELVFSVTQNYETLPWRMLNLLFLLGGFLWMVYDYAKHQDFNVGYFEGFKLCITAGIYFCLMFFPLLFLALEVDHADWHRLQLHTAFRSQQKPFEIIGALFIEVPVFITIASLAAAAMVGMNKTKNFL